MGKLQLYSAIILIIALGFLAGYIFKYTGLNEVTGAATSSVGNFTAYVVSGIACTWSNAALNVTFGYGPSPALTQNVVYNASKNFEGYIGGAQIGTGVNWTLYNVTADSTNTDSVNITISGRHPQAGANILGIGNITWMSNQTNGNGSNGDFVGQNFSYDAVPNGFKGFNLTLATD